MRIIPMDTEERARARRTDPDTSHEAAAVASENIREKQAYVYQVLSQLGPSTDEWLVCCYPQYMKEHPQSPSGIRSRRDELVKKGLVAWTGEKVRGQSNCLMKVWKVVE